MGFLDWLKKPKRVGYTKTVRKRLCPGCKKELRDEDVAIDPSKLKEMSEGDTFEMKCPYCEYNFGTGTLTKKVVRKKGRIK